MVYNVFTHLSVYEEPIKTGFVRNFFVIAILTSAEPNLILVYHNKLTAHPLCYLFLRLAYSPYICTIVALLKLEYDHLGFRRVEIAL